MNVNVLCESCSANATDRMTACCRRPICLLCVSARKIDRLTKLPFRPLVAVGRRLTGSYDFKCPFCSMSKYVLDCDHGSMTWASHVIGGGDDPVLVVPIDRPNEDGAWK